MNTIQKSLRSSARYLNKRSPTILTGLGVAGVISTAVLAVQATPKALYLIDEKKADIYPDATEDVYLTPIEILKATWKVYIPAVIMGGVTITAIITANNINLRRNAALAGLISITQTAMQEYQQKVIETIGEKKEELLRGEIAQDKLNDDPLTAKTIIISGGGDTLCYDSYSGRYFKSDIEKIKQTLNEFNRRIFIEDYLPINEWYDMLGLEGITAGNLQGWRVDEALLYINFSAKVATNGQPCLVLNYSPLPTHL